MFRNNFNPSLNPYQNSINLDKTGKEKANSSHPKTLLERDLFKIDSIIEDIIEKTPKEFYDTVFKENSLIKKDQIILFLENERSPFLKDNFKHIDDRLIYVCKHNYEQFVELLIINGANANTLTDIEMPILLVAQLSGFKNITNILQKNGANINGNYVNELSHEIKNKKNLNKKNIFYLIMDSDPFDEFSANKIQGAIDLGANINLTDSFGYTPLLKAAENGMVNTFKILIDSGANLSAKNIFGQNVFHIACLLCKLNILNYLIDILENKELLSKLLEEKDCFGHTPKMTAKAANNRLELYL